MRIVCMMLLTLLVSALTAQVHPTGVESFTVFPSLTDDRIKQFNSPHAIFIDKLAHPKHELLLFLPGTNGKTGGTNLFCSFAAEQGFQVIKLMYPDSIAAAELNRSSDPDAMLNFRLEIIEGKDLSPAVQVDRADSIENRLIKVLQYLAKMRPGEQWGQYLLSNGDIDWSKIVVSGLSQGAGHAALIALRHHVAGAVLFGGPKDFDHAKDKPAKWYSIKSATPLTQIFTFNNKQDRQGCDYAQQLLNCQVLGLDRYGGVADVDSMKPPFGHSHVLVTNYPGTSVGSIRAHTSVVADGSTPIAENGSPLFEPVWKYMLDGSKAG